MEVEPGPGWADALSKILRMGTRNPESNRILSKAKKDVQESDDEEEKKVTLRLDLKVKPDAQKDALVENELKSIATRGVVHLFNAVKTVNPKSDKKRNSKKKKKRKKKRKTFSNSRRRKT